VALQTDSGPQKGDSPISLFENALPALAVVRPVVHPLGQEQSVSASRLRARGTHGAARATLNPADYYDAGIAT